ncbi:hypothetical protein EIP91_000693 [Steccherinum ochraceum]|uniref:Uncharacterized protein n=1 Tax=Steccherinum ochraceum TaxID=92696 RepID=A0A4R0RVX6_9APHY|nr:hypothetical protein EIP91_000693 [Steccherinum ochraceum]
MGKHSVTRRSKFYTEDEVAQLPFSSIRQCAVRHHISLKLSKTEMIKQLFTKRKHLLIPHNPGSGRPLAKANFLVHVLEGAVGKRNQIPKFDGRDARKRAILSAARSEETTVQARTAYRQVVSETMPAAMGPCGDFGRSLLDASSAQVPDAKKPSRATSKFSTTASVARGSFSYQGGASQRDTSPGTIVRAPGAYSPATPSGMWWTRTNPTTVQGREPTSTPTQYHFSGTAVSPDPVPAASGQRYSSTAVYGLTTPTMARGSASPSHRSQKCFVRGGILPGPLPSIPRRVNPTLAQRPEPTSPFEQSPFSRGGMSIARSPAPSARKTRR